MPKPQIRVTFKPSERSVHVLEGTTILQAATQAGLVLHTPCGGAGTCGKCKIQVTTNSSTPSEADLLSFSATQLKEGWRLACQTVVQKETVVYVPEPSCFTGRHQIVTESQTPTVTELSPLPFARSTLNCPGHPCKTMGQIY